MSALLVLTIVVALALYLALAIVVGRLLRRARRRQFSRLERRS